MHAISPRARVLSPRARRACTPFPLEHGLFPLEHGLFPLEHAHARTLKTLALRILARSPRAARPVWISCTPQNPPHPVDPLLCSTPHSDPPTDRAAIRKQTIATKLVPIRSSNANVSAPKRSGPRKSKPSKRSSPRAGDISPRAGDISPRAGDISPRAGGHPDHTAPPRDPDIDPEHSKPNTQFIFARRTNHLRCPRTRLTFKKIYFSHPHRHRSPPEARMHAISPRAGDISPRAGAFSPRAGDISPRAGDISPRAGDISPRAGAHPDHTALLVSRTSTPNIRNRMPNSYLLDAQTI